MLLYTYLKEESIAIISVGLLYIIKSWAVQSPKCRNINSFHAFSINLQVCLILLC